MRDSTPDFQVYDDTSPLLAVHRTDVGYRTVLTVIGEVDLASASDLLDAVGTASDSGAQELWVDLSATTFLDSCGLHLLLDTDDRARGLDRSIAIICPPGNVRRTFELAGLAHRLPLYDDLTAAHAMRPSRETAS